MEKKKNLSFEILYLTEKDLKAHFQPWCNGSLVFVLSHSFCLNSTSNWSVIFTL